MKGNFISNPLNGALVLYLALNYPLPMKYLCLSLLVLSLFSANAQHMSAKLPNYTSFQKNEPVSSATLDKISSADAKKHPEYGVVPYNAPCGNCVEVLDKRTGAARQFIETENEKHTYSQQSYFPLHYKRDAADVWHTIDPRLQPAGNNLYTAANQPVPTKCDMNAKSTSLGLGNIEFEFNKGLSMYCFHEGVAYSSVQGADYTNYTIGSEGLKVSAAWPGMDMVQQFSVGEVKTSYVINQPLTLPVSYGYMVIEDHFTLPAGYTFVQEKIDGIEADGYYYGNYQLRDAAGKVLATYEQPVYLDARTWGIRGAYKLLQNGNDYTLRMLVPVSWLNNPDNVYPLVIDPIVSGTSKRGDYSSTPNGAFENFGFTSMNLGSCDYNMTVAVPGKSTITNAYAELEYRLTYDPMCGNPNLPAPFCTFSQVSMEVVCDSCGTSSGLLACNPANPPYTGTCTTDPTLVPGASPILINTFAPNYLSCYTAQCEDYQIDFTLKNRDSTCQDVCGYLCANGTMWQMTVEAWRQAIDTPVVTVNEDTLFSTLHPNYQWTLNGNDIPTANGPRHIFTQPGLYAVYTVDSCGEVAYSNTIEIIGTGITNLEDRNVTIYPNPATNELNIVMDKTIAESITVYDASGRKVIEQPFTNKLNIAGLAKGAYTLQLKVNSKPVRKTFTKQ